MPFVRLARFPGATGVHFRALARAMGAHPEPTHRLLFAAGPVEDGWQVVQVWTAREHLDRFNAEHFLPALERLGADGFPAPPEVTDFTAEDFVLGATPPFHEV